MEPTLSDPEFRKLFEAAANPLIKFLNDHPSRIDPHYSVIVTPTSAELVSGQGTHRTIQFVKD